MSGRLINVMHLVDSLAAGGTERVAVNLVNAMPRDRYCSHLCTTRQEGPLADLVHADVGRLQLARRSTWDISAIMRLVRFIREHNIQILHAHSSSVFVANVASRFAPYPRIIWHDHYGINSTAERAVWKYRLLMGRVKHVFAVSQPLVDWACGKLGLPKNLVQYLPNFVNEEPIAHSPLELPGRAGSRIVCVANVRPIKDHPTLLSAMAALVQQHSQSHLLLVGATTEAEYLQQVQRQIRELHLENHVSILGQRRDVPAILRQCDVGVLSSAAEGLPLSLLEYGMAGLPVVSTNVGQCGEVLQHGEAGVLVPSGNAHELANALAALLESSDQRILLGSKFKARVQSTYSSTAVLGQITRVYDSLA